MKTTKKQPKFTIVTVTYNAENFLENTIKSIINQTYKDFEYIIIDGKSTDKTLDIVKKYEKHITYWKSEPDDGIYYAMNKAIDIANGEYINFMNAGDSFASSNILEIVNENLDEKIDFFYGGVNFIENGKLQKYIKPKDMDTIYRSLPFTHQSLFVKVSIMKKHKFNTIFKVGADMDFFFVIYTRKYNFKYLDMPVSNFLRGGYSEQNLTYMQIEGTYIISRYLTDTQDIYKSSVAQRFILNSTDNQLISEYSAYDMFNKLLKFVGHINTNYKNIILYGNSSLCKIMVKFLTIEYKIADIKFEKNSKNFINPKDIQHCNYDAIFITLLGREPAICDFLSRLGISRIYIKKIDFM